MKEHKSIMQIVSGAYFLIVAGGLFLWIHFFSADMLVKNIVLIALGLVVLWFLLIYVVMKRVGIRKNNGGDKNYE